MKLSRHVKNNMRLYGISEDDIYDTINLPDRVLEERNKKVMLKRFTDKYSNYPLKVVYIEDKKEIFVITAYPVKKGGKI